MFAGNSIKRSRIPSSVMVVTDVICSLKLSERRKRWALFLLKEDKGL